MTVFRGELIAVGLFMTPGPTPTHAVARWDGAAWQPLGSGLAGPWSQSASAVAVYDDELIVGGNFTNAGGTPAQNLARWNGTTWSAFGAGADDWVSSLKVIDGRLIVGGFFSSINGLDARHVARWNGHSWSTLDQGMTLPSRSPYLTVEDFAKFDDDGPGPNPPTLYAGGWFAEASHRQSVGVARWGRSVLDVTRQPDDRTVCTGAAASFNVEACAEGPIEYQWRRGGVPLIDGGNVSGATTPTLTIDPVTLADAALDYDCLVTTPAGSTASHRAALVVYRSGGGDGNGDGATDGLDIGGFVDGLINGGAPSAGHCAYDMNIDGVVDETDVPLFISALLGA